MGPSGQPVPDGNYNITFKLYDESSNIVWTESHNQIFVGTGLFQILLGTITPLVIPFDKPYLLGVQIGSDPELQPRMVLTSAAYAIRAENANTLSGIPVNINPQPNALLPLDNSGKFPATVIPGGVSGNYIKKNVPDTSTGSTGYPIILISNSGNGDGIDGRSVNGAGIAGKSTAGDGVTGWTDASGQSGVFGSSTNGKGVAGLSDNDDGVTGWSGAAKKSGVYGHSENTYGYGVHGFSPEGVGVYGESSDNGVGIAGVSKNGFAGFFVGDVGISGDVDISGTLSKGAGSFKIDHPLDPANKYLYHSFVESPDMKNIYDGVIVLNVGGEATVELPAYFEALNQDFRYQLTCIGGSAPVYIGKEISNNRFTIAGGTAGLKVSWQVTGTRHDAYAQAHRIQVEVEKTVKERGKYIYPKEFGQQENMGINYEMTNKLRTSMKEHALQKTGTNLEKNEKQRTK